MTERRLVKRSGFTTAISAVILVAASATLGTMMLVWANMNLGAEQREIGEYYEKNTNLLKESLVIEDVWPSKNPANYVNITLRNNGDIALDIKKVDILGLRSDGTTYSSAAASAPFTGPNHHSSPANSDGVIASKSTLRVDVNYAWKNSDIDTLDIFITTERGSTERILWKVGS